jgi:hypothetical protein
MVFYIKLACFGNFLTNIHLGIYLDAQYYEFLGIKSV